MSAVSCCRASQIQGQILRRRCGTRSQKLRRHRNSLPLEAVRANGAGAAVRILINNRCFCSHKDSTEEAPPTLARDGGGAAPGVRRHELDPPRLSGVGVGRRVRVHRGEREEFAGSHENAGAESRAPREEPVRPAPQPGPGAGRGGDGDPGMVPRSPGARRGGWRPPAGDRGRERPGACPAASPAAAAATASSPRAS